MKSSNQVCVLKSVNKKFMDNLTSVWNFFKNSPKRQKYFECFLEFYKVDSNQPEKKWKEIIGLAKTRWVERHKAYDTDTVIKSNSFYF